MFLILVLFLCCCAVVRAGGSQDESLMKKGSGTVPVPKQKALVINETSQSRLSEERPRIASSGVIVRSSKGKEKMEAERPLKRIKAHMSVQQTSGAEEISRVEFDGDEILNLYSGDTLILPPTENSAEDVQEEIRGFIPQALKLANVVTVQINKMAMRIKELEAENAHAKEVEKNLIFALQEKSSVVHEKSVAGPVKVEDLTAMSSSENARQLQELKDDLKGHKALILSLQTQLAYEKTGTHALLEKIARLETRLHGKPVVESPPDVRRAHLMRDVEIAKEVFGEDSKEYNIKRTQLDRMLRAQAADAELKAKEIEAARLKEERS